MSNDFLGARDRNAGVVFRFPSEAVGFKARENGEQGVWNPLAAR
jgi:hypothetical protein